jgi:hypothetical protein
MLVLTLSDGLCGTWLIIPCVCWCWCPETETSSIDWAKVGTFHLETETESSPKRFYIKKIGRWKMCRNTIIVVYMT